MVDVSLAPPLRRANIALLWNEIGPVDPVPADSLEGVLHRTGHPFWFVDLRGATEPIFQGKDRCHQGLFFIDRMEATRPAPLEKK